MQTFNFAKSGNFQGGAIGTGISQELKEKLNGMLLGDAIKANLITLDANKPFDKENGEGYSRFVLRTKQGLVTISKPLAEGAIMKYINNLGDLRFILNEVTVSGRPSFVLGQPASSTRTYSDASELFAERPETIDAD